MHPVLFRIGPLPIFSYGVFVLLGTALLFVIALSLGRRYGRSWEQLWPVAIGAFVGALLVARLSHLIVEPDRFEEFANFYALLRPGTPGNVLGLLLGGYLGGLVMRERLRLPSSANFYAPAMAAASVFWRVGCTLAGCCYGKETDLPWAIYLDGAYRHPTMIMEGLFNLVLFGLLWRLLPRVKEDELLLMAYMAAYALFRFFLEFIRVYPPLALGLTGIQFLCLAMLLGIGAWFGRRHVTRRTVHRSVLA